MNNISETNTSNLYHSLVSIIIPCYNSNKTIKRALISVLNQSHQIFEIIIIDDFSSDIKDTENIINEFDDERIDLIKHSQNKNGATARNTGIKAAKGDYIAFLDDDDEWLPDHLENAMGAFNNSIADIIYSRCLVKSDKFHDLIMPNKGILENERTGDYLFINDGFIQTSAIVFKSGLKVFFNEKLRRHQDYDFLLSAEDKGYKIAMSDHLGAIVHWENNNTEAKGGTWDFSYQWVKDYSNYMSIKALKNFIFKNVVLALIGKKQKMQGLKIFLKESVFLYLPIKKWALFLSLLLFNRVIYSRISK